MLFNLIICKSERLKSLFKCSLSRSNLRKEVHCFRIIWENLLDVIIRKVNYAVPIWPHKSPHTIRENYFTLARIKEPLNFLIRTYRFFTQAVTSINLIVMILLWELDDKIVFVLFNPRSTVDRFGLFFRDVFLLVIIDLPV